MVTFIKAFKEYSLEVNGLETLIGDNYFAQFRVEKLADGNTALVVHHFFSFNQNGEFKLSLEQVKSILLALIDAAIERECTLLISQMFKHARMEQMIQMLLYFNFTFRYIGNDLLWLQLPISNVRETSQKEEN